MQGFRWATVLMAALLFIVCGCSSLGSKSDAEERARQLDRVQLRVMHFADEYVAQIVGPLNTLQSQTADPRVRLDAQNWKITQASSAYENASQSNPQDGLLDMIVLAVLSRMVVEEENANPRSPLHSLQLQDAHRKLERRAWELSAEVLTEQQRGEMQQALEQWRIANPTVRAVSLVHYGDLLQLVPAERKEPWSKGLLGRGLDPAVREIAQTRQLVQTSRYYAQRLPALLDMQVERLVYQLTLMPESRLMLENIDRVGDAAERAGRLADTLPGVVAQEREASIAQIARELNAQQSKTRALAHDLRNLLEAGTHTSDSVNATIRSIDALIVRLQPKGTAANSTDAGRLATDHEAAEKTTTARAEVRRPPVDEYVQVLNELTRTSQELQELIVRFDHSSGSIERLVTTTAVKATVLVDYVVLRLLLLALAFAVLILATMLVYRALSQRIG